MSRSDMLKHLYLLRNEVCHLINMQGIPVAELSDSGWLCDLAFMVDISIFLNSIKSGGDLISYWTSCLQKQNYLKQNFNSGKYDFKRMTPRILPPYKSKSLLHQLKMLVNVRRFLRHSLKDFRT